MGEQSILEDLREWNGKQQMCWSRTPELWRFRGVLGDLQQRCASVSSCCLSQKVRQHLLPLELRPVEDYDSPCKHTSSSYCLTSAICATRTRLINIQLQPRQPLSSVCSKPVSAGSALCTRTSNTTVQAKQQLGQDYGPG